MRYTKEIIYCGKHVMPDNSTLNVTTASLHHIRNTFYVMAKAGFTVPLQLEHTPGASVHGRVIGLSIGKNRRGIASLVATVKFDDERHAARFSRSPWDVSMFVPQTHNHAGVLYSWPLTHLALTRWPVIQRMDGWANVQAAVQAKPQQGQPQAVAASRGINALTADAERRAAEAEFLRSISRGSKAEQDEARRKLEAVKSRLRTAGREKPVRTALTVAIENQRLRRELATKK